jgi:Tfp pilus assembly protein PilV
MPAVAWFTVVVALLIIAITALGLIRVIFHLRAVRQTLVATTGGVQAVASLTSTVPERLTSVNANLKPVRDFCETI